MVIHSKVRLWRWVTARTNCPSEQTFAKQSGKTLATPSACSWKLGSKVERGDPASSKLPFVEEINSENTVDIAQRDG